MAIDRTQLLLRGSMLGVLLWAAMGSELVRAEGTASTPAADEGQPEIEMELDAAFDRARSFFRSGAFEECVESYRQLFSHGDQFPDEVSTQSIEQARLYYSACLLGLSNTKDAEAQIRAAILANPQMSSPDRVVFPPQVGDLFFKVRRELLDEIERSQREERIRAEQEAQRRAELQEQEKERVRELERLARTETMVSKNERWLASVPFGVGQYQNGNTTLGTAFLVAETLFLATTVTAVVVELDTHDQAEGGGSTRDATELTDQVEAAIQVQTVAGSALLITAAVGILEAHLNFVPEHPAGTRPRPRSEVPKHASVQPVVGGGPGGGFLGISGSF